MRTGSLITILLCTSMTFTAPRAFQVEMSTLHSPQISSFYKGIISELGGGAHPDSNATLFYKNSSTFTNFTLSFGFHEFRNEKILFTPLLTSTLGYKRLKYQTWDSYSLLTYPSFEHMRNFRMYGGLTPEIRVPIQGKTSPAQSIVIAPLIQAGGTLITGTFGSDFLFTIRTGIAVKWEMLGGSGLKKRGFSVGAVLFCEKLPSGDREYGKTYESAEWRIPDELRYQDYPGESVSFGLTFGYTMRRETSKGDRE